MKIENWKISDVKPYAKNPRRFEASDIEAVAKSIDRFGWRQPLVVAEDGELVIGHLRLAAAKQLKQRKVPVHVAVGLSDDKLRQLRLADNRLGELARWDIGLLSGELQGLEDPAHMVDLGFSEAEIEMAGIDEHAVMSGEMTEPWEDTLRDAREDHTGPKVIVHCESDEHRKTVLDSLSGLDTTIRGVQAKTTVIHFPARGMVPYAREGEEEQENGVQDGA